MRSNRTKRDGSTLGCGVPVLRVITTAPQCYRSVRIEQRHQRAIHVLPEKYQFCSLGATRFNSSSNQQKKQESKPRNRTGEEDHHSSGQIFRRCHAKVHFGVCTGFDIFVIGAADQSMKTTNGIDNKISKIRSSSPSPSATRSGYSAIPAKKCGNPLDRSLSCQPESGRKSPSIFASTKSINENSKSDYDVNIIRASIDMPFDRSKIASRIETYRENIAATLELLTDTEADAEDEPADLQDLIRNFVREDRRRNGSSSGSASQPQSPQISNGKNDEKQLSNMDLDFERRLLDAVRDEIQAADSGAAATRKTITVKKITQADLLQRLQHQKCLKQQQQQQQNNNRRNQNYSSFASASANHNTNHLDRNDQLEQKNAKNGIASPQFLTTNREGVVQTRLIRFSGGSARGDSRSASRESSPIPACRNQLSSSYPLSAGSSDRSIICDVAHHHNQNGQHNSSVRVSSRPTANNSEHDDDDGIRSGVGENFGETKTIFGISPKSSSLSRYKTLIESRSGSSSPVNFGTIAANGGNIINSHNYYQDIIDFDKPIIDSIRTKSSANIIITPGVGVANPQNGDILSGGALSSCSSSSSSSKNNTTINGGARRVAKNEEVEEGDALSLEITRSTKKTNLDQEDEEEDLSNELDSSHQHDHHHHHHHYSQRIASKRPKQQLSRFSDSNLAIATSTTSTTSTTTTTTAATKIGRDDVNDTAKCIAASSAATSVLANTNSSISHTNHNNNNNNNNNSIFQVKSSSSSTSSTNTKTYPFPVASAAASSPASIASSSSCSTYLYTFTPTTTPTTTSTTTVSSPKSSTSSTPPYSFTPSSSSVSTRIVSTSQPQQSFVKSSSSAAAAAPAAIEQPFDSNRIVLVGNSRSRSGGDESSLPSSSSPSSALSLSCNLAVNQQPADSRQNCSSSTDLSLCDSSAAAAAEQYQLETLSNQVLLLAQRNNNNNCPNNHNNIDNFIQQNERFFHSGGHRLRLTRSLGLIEPNGDYQNEDDNNNNNNNNNNNLRHSSSSDIDYHHLVRNGAIENDPHLHHTDPHPHPHHHHPHHRNPYHDDVCGDISELQANLRSIASFDYDENDDHKVENRNAATNKMKIQANKLSSLTDDEKALLHETLKIGLYGPDSSATTTPTSKQKNQMLANNIGGEGGGGEGGGGDGSNNNNNNCSSSSSRSAASIEKLEDRNDCDKSVHRPARRIILVSKPAPKPEPKPEPKYVNGKVVFGQLPVKPVLQRGSVAERVMLFEKCPEKTSVTKSKLTELQKSRIISPNKIGNWIRSGASVVEKDVKIPKIASTNNSSTCAPHQQAIKSQQQSQQQQQSSSSSLLQQKQPELQSSSSSSSSSPSVCRISELDISESKSNVPISLFRRFSRSTSSASGGGARLPPFYFPNGRPFSSHEVETQIRRIAAVFERFPSRTVTRKEFGGALKLAGLPVYWKQPLFRAVLASTNTINNNNNNNNNGNGNGFSRFSRSNSIDLSASNGPTNGNGSGNGNGNGKREYISVEQFTDYWKRLISICFDDAARFVHIVTRGERNYILPEDLESMIQDVIDTHPGLLFLKEAEEFHSRYVHTVIARIFYCLDKTWSGAIKLPEIRRSNLLKVLRLLEDEEDINQITDYFSYEHFYVIYCKFWELDQDHDLFISKYDLSRHNDSAISSRMIDRIFSGAVTRGPRHNDNQMSYAEFVWFILSEEDKRHPRAIEYWFRCMDLDGDGCLSFYELEYFYSEQVKRMEAAGIEALPFTDCLCQMIDLASPADPNRITLNDLKRCRLTPIFFDTFFNLEKYLDHEQRDPFASQRDEDGLSMSDWDRYAAEEYELLVAEENAANGSNRAYYGHQSVNQHRDRRHNYRHNQNDHPQRSYPTEKIVDVDDDDDDDEEDDDNSFDDEEEDDEDGENDYEVNNDENKSKSANYHQNNEDLSNQDQHDKQCDRECAKNESIRTNCEEEEDESSEASTNCSESCDSSNLDEDEEDKDNYDKHQVDNIRRLQDVCALDTCEYLSSSSPSPSPTPSSSPSPVNLCEGVKVSSAPISTPQLHVDIDDIGREFYEYINTEFGAHRPIEPDDARSCSNEIRVERRLPLNHRVVSHDPSSSSSSPNRNDQNDFNNNPVNFTLDDEDFW